MSQASNLYSSGLKPVYKVIPEDEKWRPIHDEVEFQKTEETFSLQFKHTFNCSSDSAVHFSFSYPYGYEDVWKQMEGLEKRLKDSEQIYFWREHLAYSIERRKVELITISDHSGKTEAREPYIKSLFPEHKNKKISWRPHIFKKQTVFFSARVHPAEVAASHVLNGIIGVLTNPDDEYGKLLRKHFVFKIIPLLNPDGVYRGYFRMDTFGKNLNRFYKDPKIDRQPTIFATKKVIMQQKELGKLAIYIDLHAHALRKGWFMFGNALPLASQQIENMWLPKIISLNNVDFDFNQWSFAEGNMNVKDKNSGLTRDGWGRVAVWKETGINNSYTLEWHYTMGINKNELTDIVDVQSGEVVPCEEDKEILAWGTKENTYTIEAFESVGQAVWVSLLDYYQINQNSRIPTTKYKNLKGVKEELSTLIQDQKQK
jgi:cytosolic carboxypeptidase protein 5